MKTIKCRSRSRSMKFKGGSLKTTGSSGSSGSSLLKELESKYSKTSSPSTGSVEKMIDELDPTSKSKKGKNSGLNIFGVALGVLLVTIVGIKLRKM
jgi:hypothetical protein